MVELRHSFVDRLTDECKLIIRYIDNALASRVDAVTMGRTGVVNVKALHFHVVIPHRAALWRQIAHIGQPGFRFNREVRRSQLLGEVLTDGSLVLPGSKKVNGPAGEECRVG